METLRSTVSKQSKPAVKPEISFPLKHQLQGHLDFVSFVLNSWGSRNYGHIFLKFKFILSDA